MFLYGSGGVFIDWATLCGALNGVYAAINLVAGEPDFKELVNELIGWYTTTTFPSDKSNEYASKHEFLVKEYKTDEVLPQSVSSSPPLSCFRYQMVSKSGEGKRQP